MTYPEFFDDLPTVTLEDDLSEFLGTFEDGIVRFSYLDIVKSAGHSCPTVLGAYLSCINGLKALFGKDMPKRGKIFISFKENENEGVAGVIANVYTQITGATKTSGFKGIAGNFVRHSLMDFGADISSDVKMTRLDTGKSIEVAYNPSTVPASPNQMELMRKIMQNQATKEEKIEFKKLWQQRVKDIFMHQDKCLTIKHVS